MLERIKEERLLARVTDKTKYALLTTVIGEYENEAKKNPNRDQTRAAKEISAAYLAII